MSIKQNGGVFGRNPTFNDVTIEGELTFDGDIDINSDLKISQDFEVVGDSGFGAAPNSNYRINALDTSSVVMAVSRDGSDGDAIQIFNGAIFGTRCLGFGVSGSNGTINNQYGNIEVTTSSALIGKFTANGFAPENGKGLDFSASAGTGTSELLDDYEEGTFTPVFIGSTTAGSQTYTTQAGFYEKIGRLVNFRFRLTINTKGTIAGNIIVGGLPFTTSSTASSYGDAYVGHAGNLAITAGTNVTAVLDLGADTMNLKVWSATTGTANITDANLTNTSQIFVTGNYSV